MASDRSGSDKRRNGMVNFYSHKNNSLLSALIRTNLRPVLFSLLIFSLFVFPSPYLADAFDISLEKDLQIALEQSRAIIDRAGERLNAGGSIADEAAQLKTIAEDIKVTDLLLQERFQIRQDTVKALGTKASERHRAMSDGYRDILQEYLGLIDSIQPSAVSPASGGFAGADDQLMIIERLKEILDTILLKKKRPIFGSLPYKNLNYPSRGPILDPSIKPAYKGGNKEVTPDDLKNTTEAPISEEIATFAQSLNWNPVSIYEYVKNNIETEWYWGCMKGAEETLRQKSGNDCDQATLLIALLRASGFPSRYVRGVIEFFPDIEKVKNLTGIDDPIKIAEFFQKSGIPYTPVIAGGGIANFQIEHIWVESRIPYANYRGAIIDEYGKTWLGLDTSIKVTGYEYNDPLDVVQELSAVGYQLSAIRDEYLSEVQTQTPLEYLESKLSAISGQPLESYKLTRSIIPEVMNILPASMQFDQKRITHEYTEIPDELMHKVRFIAKDKNNFELLNLELRTFLLSNQQVVISYEPETVEDQEIINSYGGLDNTPAYLVRLRPVLKIGGQRSAVGKDGLPMGEDYELTIELRGTGYGSAGSEGIERITNTLITGNLTAIGIVAQKTVQSSEFGVQSEEEKNAEQILYEEAINYIDRWNQAEEELASLMHLTITRPIPTVVTIGGIIDVTYLLDTPHDFDWKGVYVDADFRAIETVQSSKYIVQSERQKTFMQLSSLQGSILENRIFEDDFEVESISTAKLIQIVSDQESAISGQILTIDSTNIDDLLPTLPFDDNIKEDITNAVNQGLVVTIPDAELSYEDWTGIGYIKEDPETGESGYMLSGMVAGGMTAWGLDKWPEYYRERLKNPYSEPPNYDPESAAYIHKITNTDMQKGTVATQLAKPLQVLIHDDTMKPVKGADITFAIKAGGGRLRQTNDNSSDGSTSITVQTDSIGIASVQLILGKYTKDNPTYWWESGYTYSQQIGENIVDASLPSGTSITKPFTSYAFPGEPDHLKHVSGGGASGLVNTVAGSLAVKIEDVYNNPIANKDITSTVTSAEPFPSDGTVSLPQVFRSLKLFTKEDCPESPYITPEDCAEVLKNTITQKSGFNGLSVIEALYGNTLGTKYTVEVISYGLTTGYLYLYTEGKWKEGLYIAPFLKAQVYNTIGSDGQVIDAAKIKEPLAYPMEAEVILSMPECTGYPKCLIFTDSSGKPYFEATGRFIAEKVTNAELTPTVIKGGAIVTGINNNNDGTYDIGIKMSDTPEINTIQVDGKAKVTIPHITEADEYEEVTIDLPIGKTACYKHSQNDTGYRCDWGDTTVFETLVAPTEKTYYSVLPEITTKPIVLLVGQNGILAQDTPIQYTIKPIEYTPGLSYLFILKNGETFTYTTVQVDANGAGTFTLLQGMEFDITKTYEALLVLNYGSEMEMRSDKEELMVAKMSVVNENGEETEELRYSNGTNGKKKYHIELEIGKLFGTISCEDIAAKISTRKKDDTYADVPSTNYPGNYINLSFYNPDLILSKRCVSENIDITTDNTRKSFIITNLSKESLGDVTDETAPLYGGIGNKFKIELFGSLYGVQRDLPIEPVGVIVIGIDGLRQDVLYPDIMDGEQFENVNEGVYYVDASTLGGLGQVLIGNPADSTTQQYIMLPEVTAIFPSITLASWASIFTGKLPNETGITGNEFFTRDNLNIRVPAKLELNNPTGIVSFGSGAFKGYDKYSHWDKLNDKSFFVPYQAEWYKSVETLGTPQNDFLIPKTIYESLVELPEIKSYFSEKGGDPVVAAYSHYARGAYWLTWGLDLAWGASESMDQMSWGRFDEYLRGKYLDIFSEKRNDIPFSALTVWYLAGLDHEAHGVGMSVYRDYFINTTDMYIKKVIDRLKELDEFDNKIFVITADHGHTDMPTDLTYKDKNWLGIEVDKPAEMSCEVKLDFVDPKNPTAVTREQKAERENNNLHIWELGEVLKLMPTGEVRLDGKKIYYKVLAPTEIVKVNKGETTTNDTGQADLIAAFNGPMAHIYVKGENGWDDNPQNALLLKVADLLSASLAEGDGPIPLLASSIDAILVRLSRDSEYVVYNGATYTGEQIILNNPIPVNTYFSDNSKYVDALNRIEGMNHPDRSGDIVLLMKDNTSGTALERYSTGSACKAWHGSLNPSDSYVPLIISYPGGNKHELDVITQKVCIDNLCEGNWKAKDLITEIIKTQYSGQ